MAWGRFGKWSLSSITTKTQRLFLAFTRLLSLKLSRIVARPVSQGAKTARRAMSKNNMKTINPFHNPTSAYSHREFTYDGKCLFEHRGVQVFKNPAGSWDYVIAGMTITQRAGFSKDHAVRRQLIDDILDGTGFEARSEPVCVHLRKLGFTPISYADLSNVA
jgi:hypothetical protein